MARLLFLLHSALAAPPNIVYLLVDDLGYAGVGFNSPSGEPKTPTIDSLAKDGVVLQRHYAYQFCSPTRSSFLSGRLPIHVNQQNHPPCELGGGVPANMTSIAAVLKRGGYATHHAGKWHGGMSHQDQLPINKGFDSSLAMLSGAADHFTNKRACGGASYVDLWKNDQPAHSLNGSYSEFTYVSHMVDAIKNHNTQQPLFLFMAFQNVHGPTQAPDRFLQLYDDSIFKARRNGLAQISAVDEGIANITAALKVKGMWENTMLVFSSDNGGPADHENNFPLRGSKGSDFEGGVRVVSFVSGGWLPEEMRGKTIDGLMHVADWYATFADVAGVDPTDAQAAVAGLPAIDSLSMLKLLTGANSTSPRSELPLSHTDNGAGIISGKYKFIVRNKPITNGFFPGKTTPNGTAYGSETDCSAGCLFDLDKDEVEHQDLASAQPKLVATLQQRLKQIGQTVYQSPGAGPQDDAKTMADAYGGFWGPWEGLVPHSDSFFLVRADSSKCLRASSLDKSSELEEGACDEQALWAEDSNGFLFASKAKDPKFKYMRPSDHYPDCTVGHGTRIGTLTQKGIGAELLKDELVLNTCPDKCVGAGATLVACADGEVAWTQQRSIIV